MCPPTVQDSGVERRLGTEDLIVTKTDLKGRLTYCNTTFLDISAITESEALGAPHNIIRHPLMPRGVFRLLWDTLKSEQELFAFIVNRALDGASYWVLAHVTPTFGPGGKVIGYHSMRRSRDKRIEELEQEVAAHRAAIEELARVARAAAQGNLEERIHELPAVAGSDLAGLRDDLNRLIDVTDGFCREASASLLAASSGHHERQLLVRGLPGQFRDHAMSINGARAVIAHKDDELATNESARQGFAVVADEVGRLAEETRTASGRIESQLEESRNMIQETASALTRIDSDANSMRRDVDGLHEQIVGGGGSAQSNAGLTASIASLDAQVRRFLALISSS